MKAAEIIRAAELDGLLIELDDDGRLTVAGGQQARDQWRFELVSQKAEIVGCLKQLTQKSQKALAQAYHQHHFACPICTAAGQGYGLRCGVGMTLWANYQNQS